MQLKSLGNLSTTIAGLKDGSKIFADLSLSTQKTILSTKNLDKEFLETCVSGLTFTKNLDGVKVTASGLSKAEVEAALHTATLATAQSTATVATGTLGGAFKGLGIKIKATTASMWAFLTTTPIGWATLAVGAIAALAAGIYAYNKSIDEAVDNAKEKLSETETELSNVTSQIEETTSKIKELEELSKNEHLSITDSEDLEELKKQNEELAIRQAYLEKQREYDNQDVVEASKRKYAKDYTQQSVNDETVNAYREQLSKPKQSQKASSYLTGTTQSSLFYAAALQSNKLNTESNTLTVLTAKYLEYTEAKKLAISEKDSKKIEEYNQKLIEVEKQLVDERTALQEFKDDLSLNGEPSAELDDVNSKLKMIDNTIFSKGERLENYLNMDSFSENKEKLLELASQGKLTEKSLSDNFKSLYSFMKENEIGLEDLISVVKTYEEELQSVSDTSVSTPSISETIDQLNTQLKPAFDSLKSAYQDIFTEKDGKIKFTLENVDLSTLDSIKSKLDDMSELGLSIDTSSYENLARVLSDSSSTATDVQSAFDSLSSSVLNSTDIVENLDDNTVQLVASMLESLGVANAEEIVYDSLNAKTEALALQKQFAAQTGYELVNATNDEITAFLNHAGASETAKQYLFQLVATEQVFNAQGLDVSGKIAKLKELATAYGQTAIAAKIAHMEVQSSKSHSSLNQSDYNSLVNEVNSAVNNVKIDFKGAGGGTKPASKSGKEAADAYLEAFEKELGKLDDLKDRGKISEKQYLDALRKLYVKYFNQKKKYLDQYEKYESQYLHGMKSLYESAFSYITKQIDKRIDTINAEKDAAVSAIEDERDARLEAIELQKEQLENEIDGIEDQIRAKEKEIKALQDANEERKESIDLQKSEYELARMQNQKTSNVYTDDGMIWREDTSGIRDAREDVADKKLQIDISKIEKEVDLLNDQKDILEEQIDLLDKQADQINKYYDNLISQTERQYDAMIQGMENTKYKFEELSEVFENAQMEATLKELGINMDALLSGSEEEFNKLKTAYVGILADMSRGNDGVIDQLSKLGGVSAESVSYLETTKGAFENLGEVTLGTLPDEVSTVAESTGELSTSATNASSAVDDISTSASNASTSLAPLNEQLSKLKQLIDDLVQSFAELQFPEIGDENYAQKLNETATSFGNILEKCKELSRIDFSSIIGNAGTSVDTSMPNSGETDGIGSGFQGLATTISDAVTIIELQMSNLQLALETGNTAFSDQISFIRDEYIPAWEELQARLGEIIGVSGGDSGEGDKSGGKKKSSDKKDSSESGSGDGSIIDIMQTGGEEVSAKLEDPWLKSFSDFATGENSVQSICELIKEIVTEMAQNIQDQCASAAKALNDLAEMSLNVSVSNGGGGFSGKAHAKGSDGLASDEKNALVAETAPELVCDPKTGQYTLFDEPTITDLNKGTIIFNGEQTKDIFSRNKSSNVTIGNAFQEGTIIRNDGDILIPLDRTDPQYAWMNAIDRAIEKADNMFFRPTSAMFEAADATRDLVNSITTNHSYIDRKIEVNIGDIVLQGVQDVNGLSQQIKLRLPNMMLQEDHRI